VDEPPTGGGDGQATLRALLPAHLVDALEDPDPERVDALLGSLLDSLGGPLGRPGVVPSQEAFDRFWAVEQVAPQPPARDALLAKILVPVLSALALLAVVLAWVG
jgi:hypothetical protein